MIVSRFPPCSAAVSPLAVCAALGAAAVPLSAQAQCVTTTVGFTVIGFECTGFDPDGISLPRFGGFGEVGPGARVEGADAIAVDNRATILNEGVIDAGVTGIAGGHDLTVLNEGRVAGGTAAVGAGDFLLLRNDVGGVVEGGEVGIAAGLDPQIINAGAIRGGEYGIRGEDFVTVRNAVNGVIAGGNAAIRSSFNVTLDNAGLIEGGLFGEYDTAITNRSTGVIRGGIVGGPSQNNIVNDGLIDGDIYGSQGLGVDNTGTLLGGISATDEGIGVSNSGLIRTSGTAVAGFRSAGGFLFNTGEVVVGGDAVFGVQGADLTNSGIVVAGDDGVDGVTFASLDNSGTLTAADDGVVSAEVARVVNTGTIDAGSEGVEAAGQAEITNGPGGVIRGGVAGLRVGEDSTVQNRGLIRGGSDAAIRAGSGLALENRGRIENEVPGGDGIVIEGPGRSSVDIFGSLQAEGAAIRAEGAVDLLLEDGSIVGGPIAVEAGDGSSLSLSESGLGIEARGDGVRLGRDASIGADNVIRSTGTGDGASIIDGDVSLFDSTGALVAANGAGLRVRGPEPSGAPAGPLTIELDDDAIIAGDVGIAVEPSNQAAQSVTINALGTVAGDLGIAMDLGAGNDAVIAQSLAVIEGDVLFGPGDDVFRFVRLPNEPAMDEFDLFDGGVGFDTAIFEGFGLGDLSATPVAGGFEFLFEDDPSRLLAALTGFERVRLDDVTLAFSDPSDPAPIPLPAGLPMLAAGLGGLLVLRRRQERRAPAP